MVHIKRIDVRNFKSIGVRPVSIELDKGLTVITGPNGSGKSNIMDAILFCLGENSPKALKVNKLAELVYDGGSSERKPSNSRVSIVLDNADRRIPLDSDSVIVVRELKASGESNYYLNGRLMQKAAIAELLELALISPQALNVVPQGMVTRLSDLTPDHKRGLLEQTVGVAQYDSKKSEAAKQLQDADLRLQVAVARMGEIKKRVSDLEGERNDQLRLKGLEAEIQWLKGVNLSSSLLDIRRRIEEREVTLREYRDALSDLGGRIRDVKEQTTKLEVERSSLIERVVDQGGGRQVELQFAIARVTNELERLKASFSEASSTVAKINESLPYLRQMQERASKEVEDGSSRLRDAQAFAAEVLRAKKEVEAELARLMKQRARLIERQKKTEVSAERIRERVETMKQLLSELSVKTEAERGQRALLEEKRMALQDKTDSFTETLKQLEANLSELKRLRNSESSALSEAGQKVVGVRNRGQRLEAEVGKAVSTLNRAREVLLKYQAQQSVAEQVVGEELGLRKIEELSTAGVISGFVGRFGDLISYPAEYEQAVLAVGRRWSKAIVVRTLRDMLRVAEVAKRLRLTRLTVIPISEVEGSLAVSAPRVPGALSSLAEVVKVNGAPSGLVNFVFGDAILVETPRSGYLVSLGGLRSVTKRGDVFEARSVAFETGYIGKIEAMVELIMEGASLSAVDQALSSLGKTISKRKSDLKNLERESRRLDSERLRRALGVERLNAELANVLSLTQKYRRLTRSIEKSLLSIGKSAKMHDRRRAKLEGQQRALDKRLERANRKLEDDRLAKIAQELRGVDEKTFSLEKSVSELSGKTRDAITRVTTENANLVLHLQPSLDRLNEQIGDAEAQLREKQEFIEASNARLKDFSAELETLQDEERQVIESTKQSRPMIEDFEARLKALRDSEESMRRSLSNLEKQAYGEEKSLERLREDLKRLTDALALLGFTQPVEVFDGAEVHLRHLTAEYEQLRVSVNLLADRSYREVYSSYKNLSLRRNELEEERTAIVRFIEQIDLEKKRVFLSAFEKVDRELRSVFNKLTGGAAWLELEDPDNIFSAGVFLMTQFPNKVPRESSSVSGGEKTVSALSFILAIQAVYPSPFYLFDEIDAHLDAVNCQRLSELLRERSSDSQIIVISLRDSIVSWATQVFGIYMAEGYSHVIRYRPGVEVTVRSG